MGDVNVNKNTVNTLCQNCHERCKVQCIVENGKLVKTLYAKCEKGTYLHELLHNPNRLLYPMKRAGEKGSGQWTRISWDEALNIMADKFGEIRKNYGPEANCVGISSHHKEVTCDACHILLKFLNSPNIYDANHQCSQCNCIADHYTFGEWVTWESRVDYENSNCIVIWGANVTETRAAKSRLIFNAQKRGAKVIVIDPRPTGAAKKADIWLQIRPQSDGALAMGWLHILINEGLYDKEFVSKHCLGFDELRERVQPWNPERVAEITWIPKEKIIASARMYGSIRPSCIHTRLGVDGQQLNSTQACRAISCLLSIKGDLDALGGNVLHTPSDIPSATLLGPRAYMDTCLDGFRNIYWMMRNWRRSPDLEAKRPGFREYPIYNGPQEISWFDYNSHNYLLLEAMKEGKVRGLYLPGVNAVVHSADPKKVWNILKQLEFMVVTDLFMTPTAELADLVLPAAHPAEIDVVNHTLEGFGNSIVACPKVVDPPGECWDDRRMVIELGKRMGEDVPWDNVEEHHDWMLEPLGKTYKDIWDLPGHELVLKMDFKKYENPGWIWNTPTGKIELYSYNFKKLGYDPLPEYKEDPVSPLGTPDLWKEYPFIMVHHRVKCYQHTEQRNCPSLRKKAPDPEIEINSKAAEKLGIKEGDWMWLESYQLKGERVKGKAKLVDELHPNVVSMVMGWWYPEMPGPEHGCFEFNINTIIADGPPFEEFNGHAQMRGILCKAGKV